MNVLHETKRLMVSEYFSYLTSEAARRPASTLSLFWASLLGRNPFSASSEARSAYRHSAQANRLLSFVMKHWSWSNVLGETL